MVRKMRRVTLQNSKLEEMREKRKSLLEKLKELDKELDRLKGQSDER